MRLQPRHIIPPGLLVALALGGAGCSGLHHTESVSPLDFLLPGSGKALRFIDNRPPPVVNTNTLVAVSVPPK